MCSLKKTGGGGEIHRPWCDVQDVVESVLPGEGKHKWSAVVDSKDVGHDMLEGILAFLASEGCHGDVCTCVYTACVA